VNEDEKGILGAAPRIKVPKVDNAREGFFEGATKRAGCTGRITHDLRRTAVRDFLEAGVDEGTIMLLCDWKTRSVFDRYNIINQDRLAAAVATRFNGTVAAQSEGSPAAPDLVSSSPV